MTGRPPTENNHEQFRLPLLLFGVGLGGLFDGILLHQILQWHHMLSETDERPVTTVGGLEANTLADGLFHAVAFVVIVVALWLLMRARQRDVTTPTPSWRVVTGWLFIGWGAFNIVEGLVDHHLLALHHVRDDVAEPVVWDIAFLAMSLVLFLIGVALVRRRVTARTLRVQGRP